jgi:hypothetical protein
VATLVVENHDYPPMTTSLLGALIAMIFVAVFQILSRLDRIIKELRGLREAIEDLAEHE